MLGVQPLHAQAPDLGLPLLVVLGVAGLGAAVLFGLALAALLRRQSRSYLLVALAVAALLARTVVGGVSLATGLPATHHHVLEHALDVVMAGLVIAAVYHARTADPRTERGEGS